MEINQPGKVPTETSTIFTIWTRGEGETSVPMIGVFVNGSIVNLDRTTGLGKKIWDKFQEKSNIPHS